MNQTIDMETLKQMISLLTPAPVAPVKEIAPLHAGGDNVIGMAKDIEYLRGAVDNIEKKLDKMTETHVTISDFNTNMKTSDGIHSDHETRIRSVETATTRILVWGSVILILSTLAQLALKLSGH